MNKNIVEEIKDIKNRKSKIIAGIRLIFDALKIDYDEIRDFELIFYNKYVKVSYSIDSEYYKNIFFCKHFPIPLKFFDMSFWDIENKLKEDKELLNKIEKYEY